MHTTTVLLVVSVYVCGTVLGQVSFSTHWGTGKRSQLFDTQPQALPNMFNDNTNSNLVQCLSKLEFNIMRYMSLVIEVNCIWVFIFSLEGLWMFKNIDHITYNGFMFSFFL